MKRTMRKPLASAFAAELATLLLRHGVPSSVEGQLTVRLSLKRSMLVVELDAGEPAPRRPGSRWIVKVINPARTGPAYLYWSGAMGIQCGPSGTAHRADTCADANEMRHEARKALKAGRLELTGLLAGDTFKRVRLVKRWR